MTSAFIVGVAAIIISLPLKNTDQDQTLLNAIQVESTKPMPLKEIKQDEILKETIDNHNFTADESNLKSIDLPISEKNPIPTEPGIEAQSVLINSSCYL